MSEESFRTGFVALVGRPNTGKSTLLNHLIGEKISITSSRAQTTRHRLTGVKSTDEAQLLYVDTPGMHSGGKKAVNRYMNRVARNAVRDVDVVVWVVEALRLTEEDEAVLEALKHAEVPVVLAVNKVDRVRDKPRLLPFMQDLTARREFAAVVPISAESGENVDALEAEIAAQLPEGPPLFPTDQLTDATERFLAAELIREKLTRRLEQELPYVLTVAIDEFREEEERLNISATIWVERESHKGIVIGRGGTVLKEVGQRARKDMERLFDDRVHLELWVKVREGWSDDERALKSLGYRDDD
ncbi:GTP-binding protein Era [Thiohalospira halophila DSM 15071]|uniref:GTPase Era n=1 Tax=Thiohalospira halophila DSM 15071 TaxID=1123397 RepID=A0A1I1NQ76_9GAMM|nr:GTPase Era [Thiohalospira halophila]SFC99821.1 GTP-binding protein Era [Thiohalospira halophila DSM 15071]